MLTIEGLSGAYGSSPVVRDVSLIVGDGEYVALLGRNGSGKTTTLRGIMGMLPRCGGAIRLDGQAVSNWPTYRRARCGIGYVPQGRDIFPELTVEENLRMGNLLAGRKMSHPLPHGIFDHFDWLEERLSQLGGTLSGGQQQMLAVARALVAEPRVLLLDEPTEGLAPTVVDQMAYMLQSVLRDRVMAILVVEQHLAFASRLTTRGYVMSSGEIVYSGTTEEISSPQVISKYLTL